MTDQLDRIAAEGTNRAINSRDGWFRGGKPSNVIRCTDGYQFSVTAGEGNACIPRPTDFDEGDNSAPTTYDGPYTHVEVHFGDNPTPDGWDDYYDDFGGIYAYVPIPTVRALINQHGGLTDPPVKEQPMPEGIDPQAVLEQAATYVATATGVKQQFIDQGWTAEAAEQMTITIFRGGKS